MKIFGFIFGSIGILAGLVDIALALFGVTQFEVIWVGAVSVVLGTIMVVMFPKWAKE